MSDRLLPCPTCRRHIRVSETLCPFCTNSVPGHFATGRRPVAVTRRLSRAALFALGGLAIAPVACGGTTDDEAESDETEGSGGQGATGGGDGDANQPVYGAPIATGGDAGTPVYGAPFNPAGGAEPNGSGGEGGMGGGIIK